MSTLSAETQLTGRAVNWQDGSGIENPTVTLFRIGDENHLAFVGQTDGDEDGRFSFPAEAGAAYLIVASHLDYFANHKQASVGDVVTVELLPQGFEGADVLTP